MSTYLHILAFITCCLGLMIDVAATLIAALIFVASVNEEDGAGCLVSIVIAAFVVLSIPGLIFGIKWAFGG